MWFSFFYPFSEQNTNVQHLGHFPASWILFSTDLIVGPGCPDCSSCLFSLGCDYFGAPVPPVTVALTCLLFLA